MNLQETVKRALKGLLLPPLRDIVIEYVPDRGIMTIHPGQIVECPVTFQTTRWMDFPEIHGTIHSSYWWIGVQFHRKLVTFDPFTVHFEDLSLKPGKWMITIVYQGEPEVVQSIQLD
jgi:hypothetical protein